MTAQHTGTILIVGATSDISRQLAACFASQGYCLLLAGRNLEELDAIARDLSIRFEVSAKVVSFDIDHDEPAAWIPAAVDQAEGTFAGLVVGLGMYAKEAEVAKQPQLADRMDHINHRTPTALVEAALGHIQATGFACVISSVAGDRVRPSLASYAQSKADLNDAMQTLRQQQSDGQPLIVVAKPGPTDTRMTWGYAGPSKLADANTVARDIVRAIQQRRAVLYTPSRWRWIMLIICLLPGPLFRWLFRRI